jgi:hypothetical protein
VSTLRLPHRNAVLTSIKASSLASDWDTASSDGAVIWTGTADAVIVDDTRRVTEGSDSSKIVTRTVILPSELTVTVGNKLSLDWNDTTITPIVKSVVRREPPAPLDGTLLIEVELT